MSVTKMKSANKKKCDYSTETKDMETKDAFDLDDEDILINSHYLRENVIDDIASIAESRDTLEEMHRVYEDFADLYEVDQENRGGLNKLSIASTSKDNTQWNKWGRNTNNLMINLSDLVEDNTVSSPQLRGTYHHVFEPSEITGRSTSCSQFNQNATISSPSVEQILAQSFSEDVRSLGSKLENMKFRQSLSRASLPRTADMSCASTSRSSDVRSSVWGNYKNSTGIEEACCVGEKFVPNERLESMLQCDEQSWKNEYAPIPMHTSSREQQFDSVSTYNDRLSPENYSIGQFFSQRSDQLLDMLSGRSPTKQHRPSALTDKNSNTFQRTEFNQFEPNKTNKTYELKAPEELSSVMSCSTIAKHLYDFNDEDSPRTMANKLCSKNVGKRKTQNTSPPPRAEPPLADILYITKPLPIKKTTSANSKDNKKIEILKVEEFYGNLPVLNYQQSVDVINLDVFLKTKQQNELFKYDFETNKENLTTDTLSATDSLINEPNASAQPEIRLNNETIQNENNALNHEEESSTRYKRKRSRNRSANATKDLEAEYEVIEIDDYPNDNDPPKNVQKSPEYGTNKLRNEMVNELAESPSKKTKYPSGSSPTASVMSSPRFCSSKTVDSMVADQRYRKNLKFPQNIDSNKHHHDEQHRSQSISPTIFTQCSSQCSSTNDLRDGKNDVYNLKSSHGDLSWGSTKLRKSVKKSFTIKNTAEKRISLKMEIIGPGFQICGAEQSCILTLQQQECRTITIAFCPTIFGPAIGQVCFSPARDNINKTYRIVYLYGYGGNTVLHIQGIEKGPIGASFLKLGDSDDLRDSFMERTFRIYNKGPLKGVAIIWISKEKQDLFEQDKIQISPSKCVIMPDSYRDIRIRYIPKRSDIKKILKYNYDVFTITKLCVILGDEPNRQRVLSLLNRTEQTTDYYMWLRGIIDDCPSENKENFDIFRENQNNISDLFSNFKREEIDLTVNRSFINDTNKSDNECLATEIDNTVLFQTLMPIASGDPITHSSNYHLASPSTRDKPAHIGITVEPTHLDLNPFGVNNSQKMVIKNLSSMQQSFELASNYRHILQYTPSSGIINVGDEFAIHVKIIKTMLPSDPIVLTIYTEMEKIHVPVHVERDQYLLKRN